MCNVAYASIAIVLCSILHSGHNLGKAIAQYTEHKLIASQQYIGDYSHYLRQPRLVSLCVKHQTYVTTNSSTSPPTWNQQMMLVLQKGSASKANIGLYEVSLLGQSKKLVGSCTVDLKEYFEGHGSFAARTGQLLGGEYDLSDLEGQVRSIIYRYIYTT